MKGKVDPNRCVGHAQCAARAPEVFALDDNGYAVSPGDVAPELEQEAKLGAEVCPERAITLG